MPYTKINLQQFKDILSQYVIESAKLTGIHPDYDALSSDEINEWFNICDHRIIIRNQFELTRSLYFQLSEAYNELNK